MTIKFRGSMQPPKYDHDYIVIYNRQPCSIQRREYTTLGWQYTIITPAGLVLTIHEASIT